MEPLTRRSFGALSLGALCALASAGSSAGWALEPPNQTGKPRCLREDLGQSGTLQHDVGPILGAEIVDRLSQVGHKRGVDAMVAGVLAGRVDAEFVQVDADDRRGATEPGQLTAQLAHQPETENDDRCAQLDLRHADPVEGDGGHDHEGGGFRVDVGGNHLIAGVRS